MRIILFRTYEHLGLYMILYIFLILIIFKKIFYETMHCLPNQVSTLQISEIFLV